MSETLTFFSKNLRTWIFMHGQSQAEFAEKIGGIPFQTVSKWLSTERLPEFETLIKISNYMGMTVEDLVKRDMTVDILKKSKYSQNIYDDPTLQDLYKSEAYDDIGVKGKIEQVNAMLTHILKINHKIISELE